MSDERNVPQRVLQPVVEHSQDLFGPARRDGIDGKQLVCIGRIRIPVPMAQRAMALYDRYPEMRHVSHFDSVKAAMQVLPRYGRLPTRTSARASPPGRQSP